VSQIPYQNVLRQQPPEQATDHVRGFALLLQQELSKGVLGVP